jgi:hypothetical protein
MSRATDDGREYGSRGVVSSEPGFAHSGSIIHDECCYFFIVTHCGWFGWY